MTLKPAAWMCGSCHDDCSMEKDVGCVNCSYRRAPKPSEPLFTRDDLVRAVMAAFVHPPVTGRALSEQAEALAATMLGEVEK